MNHLEKVCGEGAWYQDVIIKYMIRSHYDRWCLKFSRGFSFPFFV